ncbi:NADH kinase pos5, variant 2 [Entomophthora muscae]|nr:NADH kinase pos5, variant 2 [Entomophthora muscae]
MQFSRILPTGNALQKFNRSGIWFGAASVVFRARLSTLLKLPHKVEFELAAPTSRVVIPKDDPIKPNLQHLNGLGLRWRQSPKTVLIVKKPQDVASDQALIEVSNWLKETYKTNIIIEPHIKEEVQKQIPYAIVFSKDEIPHLQNVVDFVVTLGGDGSILHVSSLFNKHVPPLISFSMGRLGFLLPFKLSHFKKELGRLMNGSVTVLERSRLQCRFVLKDENQVKWNGTSTDIVHVANEVNVHRGVFPNLTSINCYVDGLFLTNGIADG